jgi:hypothetical protein
MADWSISFTGTGEEIHQVDISSIITQEMELRPFLDALLLGKDVWIKRLASCGQYSDGEGVFYEVMMPGKRLFYVTTDTSCGSEGCGLYISIFFKKNTFTPECP